MSKLEMVREAYGHSEWATGRLLDMAAQAQEEELRARPLGSYTDIVSDLAHVVGAQVSWLNRWRTGRTPADILRFERIDTLAEVRAEAAEVHADLRIYLTELTEDDLDVTIPVVRQGEKYTLKRWWMLHHVANHNTYHRGEVALMLTALGQSPGELDYLYYMRTRSGA